MIFRNRSLVQRLSKRVFHDNHVDSELVTTHDRPPAKVWSLFAAVPKIHDLSASNIILFPGQGAQFIGMGNNLLDKKECRFLYEVASEYLKFDLIKLCTEGPISKLSNTIYCQPAIFVTSLAAMEKIRLENPEIINNTIATAGFSLGEITSLVFSGALSFEAGLHFIKVRAQEMQKACNREKSGLLTVSLTAKSELGKAMEFAKQYCLDKVGITRPTCQISTNLFTCCKIVGGHVEALDFLQSFSKDFNLGPMKRVDVSGAFHTGLMYKAAPPCSNALKRLGGIKEPPRIFTMSNATGTIHTSPRSIQRLLVDQIFKPVLWEQIIHKLTDIPVMENDFEKETQCRHPKLIEIGPGDQLGKMFKRTNLKAFRNYTNIKV